MEEDMLSYSSALLLTIALFFNSLSFSNLFSKNFIKSAPQLAYKFLFLNDLLYYLELFKPCFCFGFGMFIKYVYKEWYYRILDFSLIIFI